MVSKQNPQQVSQKKKRKITTTNYLMMKNKNEVNCFHFRVKLERQFKEPLSVSGSSNRN